MAPNQNKTNKKALSKLTINNSNKNWGEEKNKKFLNDKTEMTNRQRKETMLMFIVTDNQGNVNQNDTELSLPTSENGPDQNPEITSQVDM